MAPRPSLLPATFPRSDRPTVGRADQRSHLDELLALVAGHAAVDDNFIADVEVVLLSAAATPLDRPCLGLAEFVRDRDRDGIVWPPGIVAGDRGAEIVNALTSVITAPQEWWAWAGIAAPARAPVTVSSINIRRPMVGSFVFLSLSLGGDFHLGRPDQTSYTTPVARWRAYGHAGRRLSRNACTPSRQSGQTRRARAGL